MKKIIITVLSLLITFSASMAGNNCINSKMSPNRVLINDNLVFHLDLMSPGVFAEIRIFDESTLFAGYQYGLQFSYNDKEEQQKVNEPSFLPQIMLSYRQYYNVSNRIINNRDTDKFSADYFGLHVSNVFQTELNNSYLVAGPVWGIQRYLADFIHINVSIGFGYYYSSTNSSNFNHLGPIADFHIGFSI